MRPKNRLETQLALNHMIHRVAKQASQDEGGSKLPRPQNMSVEFAHEFVKSLLRKTEGLTNQRPPAKGGLAIFVGRPVILVEQPDGDAIAPFQRLLQGCIEIIPGKAWLLLELVDSLFEPGVGVSLL